MMELHFKIKNVLVKMDFILHLITESALTSAFRVLSSCVWTSGRFPR